MKLLFASRVDVEDTEGRRVFTAHAEQALRLVASGQVAKPKKRSAPIKILTLTTPIATKETGEHRSSNSLISGYMEALEGGNTVRIDAPNRPTRTVETNGCQAYKLKRIQRSLLPLYITAITDCLVPARA